jgi:predicted transcriptional regulator
MNITKETRQESYEKTLLTLGPQLRQVFGALFDMGPSSAWQIARKMNREVYQIRPKLTNLRDMGLIKAVGKRYEPLYDRNEAIWDIVDGQLRLI